MRRVCGPLSCTAPALTVRIRTTTIIMLLRSRSANISEVADQTGYQDYRSFTRAFKNEIGMTPSEYQKQFQDSGGREGTSEGD